MAIGSPQAGHSNHTHTWPGEQGFTYNVMKYGAVGDGITDDTKAFISAWNEACLNANSPKITVPGGKTFMVSAAEFAGPCKPPSITFEILGKIIAPLKSAWKNQSAYEWIYFYHIDGLIVEGYGQGIIDGQGDSWWRDGPDSARPSALRFELCKGLQVRGLKHINSQNNHVTITNCSAAYITNLHMSAPQTSPNTDGIDISNSVNINITNSIMATGDDCIAITGGTYNVIIFNITCGPGHGISIGSLGKNGKYDEVEGVHVSNCTFDGTQNGVRIKTWQGGSGFVRNVTFSGITFIQADNPIVIDQYYCARGTCINQTSAVQISDVTYRGLQGTTICKSAAVRLSCSQTVPCTNIVLTDVNIKAANGSNTVTSQCINAHGRAYNCFNPVVNCLET